MDELDVRIDMAVMEDRKRMAKWLLTEYKDRTKKETLPKTRSLVELLQAGAAPWDNGQS